MTVPAKLAQVWGYAGALESAYNDNAAPTNSTDGILPFLGSEQPPQPEAVEYVYDGDLGRAPGTLATQIRAAPNGRFRRLTIPVRFKGAGTAYSSAAVTPPNEVHTLLQAAGYNPTFDTDHWDWAPEPAGTGFSSLSLRDYRHGERFGMSGCIADWSYSGDSLGPPLHEFALVGVAALPEDDALPTITYPYAAVQPPVAAGVVVNIGDFEAPVMRRFSFSQNRLVDAPRARQTAAGGHLGFVPGGMTPTWEIEIEKTALATTPFHAVGGIDPYRLMENATSIPFALRVGTVSNNRWQHGAANAQITNVESSNDGNVATVVLTIVGHASSPTANDSNFLLID
jgi:hypothetical protein